MYRNSEKSYLLPTQPYFTNTQVCLVLRFGSREAEKHGVTNILSKALKVAWNRHFSPVVHSHLVINTTHSTWHDTSIWMSAFGGTYLLWNWFNISLIILCHQTSANIAVADEHNSYHRIFLSQIAVKGHKMPHFSRVSGWCGYFDRAGRKLQFFANRGKMRKSLVVE